MKLERALVFSSMLVALSGIIALILTLESPLWLTVPAAGLTAAAALRPSLLSRLELPARALAPAAIAALGFAVIDFFYIGGSLIIAGADLMVLLLCLKALTLREPKDYIQLYAASLFVLLASTGLSTEIYFVAPFVMFFVSLTWALMLLTVKGEAQSASANTRAFRFGRGFFGGTALLTAASFAVTLAIFFAIPRIGIGFMSKRAGGLLRTSGFSDSVDLGSMGDVKLDPSVVMRVHLSGFTDKPDFPLYWRGRTFDRYDGRSWKDTSHDRTGAYRGRGGNIYLRQGGLPAGMVVQEIALEPLDTATLFALNPAYMLNSDFRSVRIGHAGELFLPYPPGRRLHYTAYSALKGGTYRPDDLPGESYLQLPEDSENVRLLAMRVTQDAVTAREKAEAVIAHLSANQKYTLSPRPDRSMSPIDDFLFGSRAGFCEHFATAMTLMLRSAGVHARMVSGFMGGEWNGYGGYLLVREQDAHTWVEVYVPGNGWELYDPTPPAPTGEGSAAGLGPLSGILDYLRFRWDRYIVYYNLTDQLVAVGWMSGVYYSVKNSFAGAASSLKKGLSGGLRLTGPGRARGVISAAALLGMLAAAGFAVWRTTRRRARAKAGSSVRFYAEVLALLGRKGYARPAGKTPMEFARMLPAGPGRLREAVLYVTEMYYRVQYGKTELGGIEKEQVRKIIEGIKKEDNKK